MGKERERERGEREKEREIKNIYAYRRECSSIRSASRLNYLFTFLLLTIKLNKTKMNQGFTLLTRQMFFY